MDIIGITGDNIVNRDHNWGYNGIIYGHISSYIITNNMIFGFVAEFG